MCSRALAADSSTADHADLSCLPRAAGPARGLQRGPAPAIATLPRRAAERAAAAAARLAQGQRVLIVGDEGAAVARLAAAAGAAVTVRAHLEVAETLAAAPAATGFDRVLLLGVLERAHDPRGTLTRCCGLLAPGGRLVVSVPPRGLGGQLYRLQRRLGGTRIRLFSPSWCARVGREAGLWTRAIVEPTSRCALIVLEADT